MGGKRDNRIVYRRDVYTKFNMYNKINTNLGSARRVQGMGKVLKIQNRQTKNSEPWLTFFTPHTQTHIRIHTDIPEVVSIKYLRQFTHSSHTRVHSYSAHTLTHKKVCFGCGKIFCFSFCFPILNKLRHQTLRLRSYKKWPIKWIILYYYESRKNLAVHIFGVVVFCFDC